MLMRSAITGFLDRWQRRCVHQPQSREAQRRGRFGAMAACLPCAPSGGRLSVGHGGSLAGIEIEARLGATHAWRDRQ